MNQTVSQRIDRSASEERFRTVVERFGPALWRLAGTYEFHAGAREELYQEILVAIWQALPRLRHSGRLRAFVFRIAHNRSVSHLAGEARRSDTVTLEAMPACDGPGPYMEAEVDERRQRLATAVQSLPLGQRQAVTLFLEGLSYAEIAQACGITETNAGVRVSRARNTLMEKLSS